ncbi:Isochorismatase hydrolase [Ramaria rubella]|nr:Isochorismatase hydrolase [Ramaria rubella]
MPGKALLLVDIQYDFLPSGALAVPDGDTILPYIYDLLEHAEQYEVIVASLLPIILGHPLGHVSFASTHARAPFTEIQLRVGGKVISQMLWPDHCIQETQGSKIEQGVQTRLDALGQKVTYVRKGTHIDMDAYSAFSDNEYTVFTQLAKILYQNGISEVEVAGLALDYCVKYTVIDSRKFGFQTRIFKRGTKAVDPTGEKGVLELLRKDWKVEVIA